MRKVENIAEKYGISYQFRTSTSGGNDAGAIHKTKEGSKAVAISLPCRYIHSPVSVASKNDYDNVVRLIKAVISENQKGE